MPTSDRLSEIVEEVFDTIGAENICEYISPDKDKNYPTLNSILKRILDDIENYKTLEVAMYLRACGNISGQLSYWKPLLKKGVEMGKQRNEDINDMFFGMMGDLN